MPPHFSEGGGGKDMFVPPFQTQNLGLGIEPTDICDVTLIGVACITVLGPSDVPPPTFCHVPTPLQVGRVVSRELVPYLYIILILAQVKLMGVYKWHQVYNYWVFRCETRVHQVKVSAIDLSI